MLHRPEPTSNDAQMLGVKIGTARSAPSIVFAACAVIPTHDGMWIPPMRYTNSFNGELKPSTRCTFLRLTALAVAGTFGGESCPGQATVRYPDTRLSGIRPCVRQPGHDHS